MRLTFSGFALISFVAALFFYFQSRVPAEGIRINCTAWALGSLGLTFVFVLVAAFVHEQKPRRNRQRLGYDRSPRPARPWIE